MRRTRALACPGVVAVAAVVAAAMPATAQDGGGDARPAGVTVELLPGLGGGTDRGYDINDRGQVVGLSTTPEGWVRGVLWDGGEVVDLTPHITTPPLGGPSAVAEAVNERGLVAGSLTVFSPTLAAGWVWDDGELTDLGPMSDQVRLVDVGDGGHVVVTARPLDAEGPSTRVWADGEVSSAPLLADGRTFVGADVNGRGVVAGRAGPVGSADAAVWRVGQAPALLGRLPGGGSTVATAVNDRGDVAGVSLAADGTARAVRWRNGRITDLGTLGGASSSTTGTAIVGGRTLNERGDVVGDSTTASGEAHAFLWRNGRMTDLGTLGGTFSSATGVNDRGQVIGRSQLATGEGRAFLWQDGHMVDLGALVDPTFFATDINDRGEVTGFTEDGRAFVVRVPPPRA